VGRSSKAADYIAKSTKR